MFVCLQKALVLELLGVLLLAVTYDVFFGVAVHY